MFFKSLIFLLGMPAIALAASPSLTINEAQQIALTNQPLLNSQQAMIDAARQTAVADAQLPDPKLKLGLNNLPTNNFSLTQDFMTARTVAIEQSFFGGNKRQLRGQRAGIEADLNVAELNAKRSAIQRDAALAWLNVYYPARLKTLVEEQRHEIQQQVKAARINYSAAKANQEDVLATQNVLNQLLDRDLELTMQIRRARAELARWIGSDAGRDVAETLPVLRSQLDIDKLRTRLVEHPEIEILGKTQSGAETDLALARESKKSDWSVEVGYSKRGPNFSDMVSAQVSIDLPIFQSNRQDRVVVAKRLLLDRVASQREDRLRSLNADLDSAYAEWQGATERISLLQDKTLPNAIKRAQATRISYQTAKTPLTMVYEAHHAVLETRMQLITQQVALAKAAVALSYFGYGEQQ